MKQRGIVHENIARYDAQPELVWSVHFIPKSSVQHETDCLRICELLQADDVFWQDLQHNADRVLIIGGEPHFLERERTAKNREQIRARMMEYEGCQHKILWVVQTDAHADRYLSVADEFPSLKNYIATFDVLKNDPHGEVWVNHKNDVMRLGAFRKDAT